ncbi:hypothetical protein T4B_3258 [Trichinella pseudospiralis]|uniref:Uncharacterized protein n=1 Tax=Trichinella pseudospiralis TaxID=6337 RepID=A0A0V1ATF4_TRIPS|nr:hypothetical protein T4A_11710 [Trichinella pseudospiralis]KRY28126.1 hypothetical protein T4A_1177 [Trichinella pseudospiralis]KRY40642.1 hypothetical protein T4A_5262 [Trichinella pseudospiralis]KRY94236.1 hypothetical protein T4B_14918 [Trichinella pseudospiralis]KRY94272.1 hypothetical protein T4B_14080 [Trichinella pseudospiralis]
MLQAVVLICAVFSNSDNTAEEAAGCDSDLLCFL